MILLIEGIKRRHEELVKTILGMSEHVVIKRVEVVIIVCQILNVSKL